MAPGTNVLVVTFDALRADRLGAYGYERPTSPRIDDFAHEAVVFERAWSTAQATPTSFAAAFTGRWPSRVFQGWELVPDVPTVAQTFAAAGYQTRFVSAQVQLVPVRGFGRGFERYEIMLRTPENDADNDNVVDDEAVLERFVNWLRKEARPPFFAWIHFMAPHSPYRVRPQSAHLYRAGYTGRFATTTGHTFSIETDDELERVRDLYDGQVLFADRTFGRLLDTVEEQGLAGSTVVVLSTDHGEELMDHGGVQHSTVFEEVIRIPLMIRHPTTRRAQRSHLPVSNVDLFPTLVEMAGLEPPAGLDGDSLLGPLDENRLRLAIAMTHRTDHFVAAARGNEKVIVDCRQATGALYDLAADPGEHDNLVDRRRRRYHELIGEVTERLGSSPCRAVKQAIGGRAEDAGLDEETREGLIALGYLGGGNRAASPRESGEGLWAEPDPILACEGLMIGRTLLSWRFKDATGPLEIRVGAPDGNLLGSVPTVGSIATGSWVTDGMEFFVVSPSLGEVLASRSVAVTMEGCPG
ncbi:MAG: sulfatase [Acidobacteriota bacterium]